MKNLYNIFLLLFLIYPTTEFFTQNVNYIYSWYKYYEPVEGKIVGSWPNTYRWNDIEKLKELKYRWGFNYVLFWPELGLNRFNMLKQIGYSPSTSNVDCGTG